MSCRKCPFAARVLPGHSTPQRLYGKSTAYTVCFRLGQRKASSILGRKCRQGLGFSRLAVSRSPHRALDAQARWPRQPTPGHPRLLQQWRKRNACAVTRMAARDILPRLFPPPPSCGTHRRSVRRSHTQSWYAGPRSRSASPWS